jgi:S1-C subfamily serine protease
MVRIKEVDPRSYAALAGIEPGMVVLDVAYSQVATPSQFISAFRSAKASGETEVSMTIANEFGVKEPWKLPLSEAVNEASALGLTLQLAARSEKFPYAEWERTMAVIASVDPDSDAMNQGLQPGTVVLGVEHGRFVLPLIS